MYQGKLNYGNLRWFYLKYKESDLIIFLIQVGVFDISSDEKFIESCIKYVKQVIDLLENKSLPCELNFFSNREYKGQEFSRDLKAYLRSCPKHMSILTQLDSKGVLGGDFMRYMVNRLFFGNRRVVIPSREDVEMEIEMLDCVSPSNITEEIELLNKEYRMKSTLVNMIIAKGTRDVDELEISQRQTKEKLQKNLKIIDVNLDNAVKILDEQFRSKLHTFEKEVDSFVVEFRESQLKKQKDLVQLEEILDIVFKSVEEKLREIKPIELGNIQEVLSSITRIEELLKSPVIDAKAFSVLKERSANIAKELHLKNKTLKNIDFNDIVIDDIESAVKKINEALEEMPNYNLILNSINQDVGSNLRKIHTKLIEVKHELKKNTGDYLNLNKSISNIKGEVFNENSKH